MIVEDQLFLREGLKAVLQSGGELKVVTEAASAEEALEKLRDSGCDVILMDINLGGHNGVWCTRSIREQGCQTPILVVTTDARDKVVKEALEAGANGYVLKDAPPDELKRAITEVVKGGSYVQPTLLGAFIKGMAEPAAPQLSRVEAELLTLAGSGLSKTQIAEHLSMSAASVASHMRSICRKLRAETLADAVEVARDMGLLPGVTEEVVEILAGTQVGSYKVVRLLGTGGMAVVYEVENRLLERKAALKVMNRILCADELATQRFRNEAKAAARIEHPNVVGIYDVGVWFGLSYIAMQLVDGMSAQERILQGSLDWREATRIVLEAARGLAAAHARQVLHRDIKPANILLASDGTVKLTDFGLAKLCEQQAEEGITRAGTILGTPEYMSPEQCRGGELDGRTDLYQLGATYYALLTGKPPYHHQTQFWEIMRAHCHEPPPELEGFPAACARVVRKTMQKNPDARYPGVDELIADLQAAWESPE